MKHILFLLFINIIFVLVQDSFFFELLGGASPSLVLALSFALLLLDKDDLSLTSALTGGLVIDILGIGTIGYTAVLFVLFILFAKLFRTYIFKGLSLQVALLILATLVYKKSILLAVFYSGLLNVVLMLLLVFVLSRLNRKFLSTTYRIRA